MSDQLIYLGEFIGVPERDAPLPWKAFFSIKSIWPN